MNDDLESSEIQQKSISILAIFALLFGFFSFLVFLSPSFYFVPVIALILVICAFVQIRLSANNMIGKGIALTGLWLLLIPSIAQPVMNLYYKDRLLQDAKRYCDLWLDHAKKGNVRQIRQMQNNVHIARSSQDDLTFWKQFTGEEEFHEGIHRFLANPLLLTLAALGDKAKTSFVRAENLFVLPSNDKVLMIYAVTYPNKENQKETFFIQIDASRETEHKYKIGLWRGGENVKGPLPLNEKGEPVAL